MDLDDDGSGTILIRRSTTAQEGQKPECYVRPEIVDHLQAWTRTARIESYHLLQQEELGQVMWDCVEVLLYCRLLFRLVRNKIVDVAIDLKDVTVGSR